MQSLNQGTGSPGFPNWMGLGQTYARYKNPDSIRLFKQNPLRPKNIVPLESEYKKIYKESPQRSSPNKFSDYSSNIAVNRNFNQGNYGRGRGIKNIEYGKAIIGTTSSIPTDWKQGSLMRTSSELKVSYLDANSSLFPDIKKNDARNFSPVNSYKDRNDPSHAANFMRYKHSMSMSLEKPPTKASKFDLMNKNESVPLSGSVSSIYSPSKV